MNDEESLNNFIKENLHVKNRILDGIFEICKRNENVIDKEHFDNFFRLPPVTMKYLIKCVLCLYGDAVNERVFSIEESDQELIDFLHYSFIAPIIKLFAYGIIVFNEDGKISFMKPVGNIPDESTIKEIDEKIMTFKPLIEPVLFETLSHQEKKS